VVESKRGYEFEKKQMLMLEIAETMGLLDLKVAQLEYRLKVLQQQQFLSRAYPFHQAKLIEEDCRVQQQLHQLMLLRQTLLQAVTGQKMERPFHDEACERE
jgi:hypothetical protein